MLASQPFEFFIEPFFSLSCLANHLGEVLAKLEFSLCQSHNIHWNVVIILSAYIRFCYYKSLAQFNDLFGKFFHETLDVSNFSIRQKINMIKIVLDCLFHL